MTCECYYPQCPYHICHTDANEGPFCEEPKCHATPQQLEEYAAVRSTLLQNAELPQDPNYVD